jgi:hypothetical protein
VGVAFALFLGAMIYLFVVYGIPAMKCYRSTSYVPDYQNEGPVEQSSAPKKSFNMLSKM